MTSECEVDPKADAKGTTTETHRGARYPRPSMCTACCSAWRMAPCDYLASAPPANGCVAVFADEMTVSIFGSFFMARAIDSFVA
jgi:hypothetical protein